MDLENIISSDKWVILNVEIFKKDYDGSPFKNLNLRDFLKNDMLEKQFFLYFNSHNHKILNIWSMIY